MQLQLRSLESSLRHTFVVLGTLVRMRIGRGLRCSGIGIGYRLIIKA